MNRILTFLLTALALQFCIKDTSSYFKVIHLKCNNLENQSGIDNNPLFNWIVTSTNRGARQTAYQIILDTDPGSVSSKVVNNNT
jgi:alpha-L-rhamnosidase